MILHLKPASSVEVLFYNHVLLNVGFIKLINLSPQYSSCYNKFTIMVTYLKALTQVKCNNTSQNQHAL
jgi:hypothetical protein